VRELIDRRQAFDLLTARGGVEDEVVGPHELGVDRVQWAGMSAARDTGMAHFNPS